MDVPLLLEVQQSWPDFIVERDFIAEQFVAFESLSAQNAFGKAFVDDGALPRVVGLAGTIGFLVSLDAFQGDPVYHRAVVVASFGARRTLRTKIMDNGGIWKRSWSRIAALRF